MIRGGHVIAVKFKKKINRIQSCASSPSGSEACTVALIGLALAGSLTQLVKISGNSGMSHVSLKPQNKN